MDKFLVISDIHGRGNELELLLEKVTKEHELSGFRRIIFLGDYIGYGKETVKTIHILQEMKKLSNTVFLRGNWEDMLWLVERSGDAKLTSHYSQEIKNRGQGQMLITLRKNKEALNEFLDFIEEMKLYHVEDDYIYAHSGILIKEWRPEYEIYDFLERHKPEHFTWNFNFYVDAIETLAQAQNKEHPLNKMNYKVVAGHVPIPLVLGNNYSCPMNTPLCIGNVIGVDFGASSVKGKLGAVVLKEDGIVTYTVPIEKK